MLDLTFVFTFAVFGPGALVLRQQFWTWLSLTEVNAIAVSLVVDLIRFFVCSRSCTVLSGLAETEWFVAAASVMWLASSIVRR